MIVSTIGSRDLLRILRSGSGKAFAWGFIERKTGINLFIINNSEPGGFEPPIQFNPYNGLANRRFRPLSHSSI